jgi:peroxiredoxin
MTETTQTLGQLLAALHAERVRTWAPEALKVNIDQRRHLDETADREKFVKGGDVVPPFALTDSEGETLDSEALLKSGPLVLIFFRFAGCPACNIALPYYQRALAPGLRALGARLVAVSPQIPERLGEIRQRHRLDFAVASDRDNGLARSFGIVFTADAASQQAAARPLGEITGTGTWELPMPTIVVIDRHHRVQFADVAPDWLVRTEAAPVLSAVEAITVAKAA